VKSALIWTVFLLSLGNPLSGAASDLLSRAPEKFAGITNPDGDDDRAVRAGAKLYNRECASCHGERHGERGIGKAPRLDSQYVKGAAPGALFWVLRNGSLRRGMPSFAHLPEAQRWQIIAYLKSGPR
jgi:mono/diheme cytochrome c family protein